MIESVHFKNYKALRDTVLPLGKFTLIVGPNGSGKSTALEALRGLGDPGTVSAESIATVGVSPTKTNPVEVSVKFTSPHPGVVASRTFLPSVRGLEFPSPKNPLPHAIRDQLASYLGAIRVYSLQATAIDDPVKLEQNPQLQSNGAGLAGVLNDLIDQDRDRFDALNREVSRWFPEYEEIGFETTPQGLRAFFLRTTDGRHKIHATELSQGTLLGICMLTLAYLPEPPPLVCFEEPDHGLHPRLLRDVQDALYRLSHPESCGEHRDPIQVVATTHSPYMLDLYRDHPEQVVIAHKDRAEARFERLVDQPHVDEILQGAPLGEVWYSGVLGGVPAEK
ncbi:MAG: AAA family ATPase [Phycisphaerae bacterium]